MILFAVETHRDRDRARRHGWHQPVLLHRRPILVIQQIDTLQSHARGILAQIVQTHLVVAPAAHRLLDPALGLGMRLVQQPGERRGSCCLEDRTTVHAGYHIRVSGWPTRELPGVYSCRNACMGSMRVARRAGRNVAAAPTPSMMANTIAKLNGSLGFTP